VSTVPEPDRVEGQTVVVVENRDLRRGWQAKVTRPIVGAGLGAVGVVLIILGYWGVAHESLVAKQIPYLVSGGIGGMVLVAVGAFLLGTDDVRRQLERVERLEEMVGDLHAALLHARGTAAAAPRASAASAEPIISPVGTNGPAPVPVAPAATSGLVALARGKSYHVEGCTMVAGKQAEPVDAPTVAERGLAPCPLCDPAPVLLSSQR
jgi:hypothetical protein